MEIMKRAEIAINASLDHYFTMLTSGDAKTEELYFLTDLISQIQGWLLFSEASLNHINNKITDSSLGLNIINNLTVLFYSRLQFDDVDGFDNYFYELNKQLAKAFCIVGKINVGNNEETPNLSILPDIYGKRLMDVKEIDAILSSNRMLVIVSLLYLFISPKILNYLK